MTDFVAAVNKATDETVMIPADWLGDPILGAGFKKAPAPKKTAAPEPVSGPSDVQVDLSTQDYLPIIPAARAAVLNPDASSDETPAVGDKE